jgi:hypothetical protein
LNFARAVTFAWVAASVKVRLDVSLVAGLRLSSLRPALVSLMRIVAVPGAVRVAAPRASVLCFADDLAARRDRRAQSGFGALGELDRGRARGVGADRPSHRSHRDQQEQSAQEHARSQAGSRLPRNSTMG